MPDDSGGDSGFSSSSGPSLEIAIGAKIDGLKAGLLAAENAVNKSAATLGAAGEKAGSMWNSGFIAKIAGMGVSIGLLNRGIKEAVAAVKADESGGEIGTRFFRGVVEGAKSVPLVGPLIDLLDYAINGAEEAAAERAANVGRRIAEAVNESLEAQKAVGGAVKQFQMTAQAAQAQVDPIAAREFERDEKIRIAKEEYDEVLRLAAESQAKAEIAAGGNAKQLRSARRTAERQEADAKRALNDILEAIAWDFAAKEEAIEKEIQEKKLAVQDAANEKAKQAREKAEAQRRQEQDRVNKTALRGMQDYIDSLEATQQPSRAERLKTLVDKAAQPMLRSGETAIGQFNFAAGSSRDAFEVAQKQLSVMETIEQLQQEMRDFQRQIAEGVAA